MRVSVLLPLLGSLLIASRLPAEDVVWVSLNAVDVVDPADHEFTDLLTGAGHSVTRFQLNAGGLLTPQVVDQFNAADLVIIGRANNSGNYNTDAEVQIWNEGITTPVLLLSPYMSRNQRFGWQAADAVPDATVSSPLVAADASHPVFTGIAFEADGVTMANNYNFVVDRGISTIGDPLVDGTVIATNPTVASGNGVAIAEWDAGANVMGTHGSHVLAAPRYFFAGGSREAAGNPIESSTLDLTADGKRLYFNMVHHALGVGVPDPADFNRDGVVDEADFTTLGSNIFGHLDGLVGFSDGDVDLDFDVDIEDFGLFKAAFPEVVARAQGVPEPSTLALAAVLFAAGTLVRLRPGRFRRALVITLMTTMTLAAAGAPAFAQIANVLFNASGEADYNVSTNWMGGVVPDGTFGEVATVNNGGTAFLEAVNLFEPGGVLLGQAAGDSGTLEIRSGGDLAAIVATPMGGTGTTPGTIVVGEAGEGHLNVLRGGTLAAVALSSGGAMDSSIVLGEAGGSGTATVTISGNADLQRTTRIVGPNVSFSVNNLTLGGSHALVAEITGATHSPITVNGAATLGGSVEAVFTGVTPSVGDSWTLVNASVIQGGGGFTSVSTTGITPPPGHGVFVDVVGQSATLSYDARLQLTVDPDTGDAAIQNLTSETFDFDGYGITSLDGTLTPGGWTSIADGDPTWNEFNPASNHLAELNLLSSHALGPNASIFLGPIFTPPGMNGTLENVSFTYHNTGGNTVQGLLAFGDLDVMPPPTGIPGDYNGNGTVEQADLDLVLLNWGQPGVPGGWVNDLPEGNIDQAELDGVLLNWGNTGAAALGNAASVPEPAGWLLIVLGVCATLAIRRQVCRESPCSQLR